MRGYSRDARTTNRRAALVAVLLLAVVVTVVAVSVVEDVRAHHVDGLTVLDMGILVCGLTAVGGAIGEYLANREDVT